MKYSIDGGNSWNDITGTTMEITGVTADNDVKVYQPGDRIDTLDSEIQTIDVTQAALPTVSSADCTTNEQNDGQITDVDATMEYKLSTSSEWTEITGTEVTGLVNGTYYVRVKANGTVLASAAATVTIGEHTCVAQQGDWQYDENNHWKLCVCGEKLDNAAHSFEWVIDKEATATQAGAKHEECTVCGYAKASVEIPATGDDTQLPQTGDNSNIALWIAVMLVAGVALTGTAVYSRKRKYSR